MGTTVAFPSNGSTASGYLAAPPSGQRPRLLVENPLGTRDEAAGEQAMGRAVQLLETELGL